MQMLLIYFYIGIRIPFLFAIVRENRMALMSSTYPLAGFWFEDAAGICSFVFSMLLIIAADLGIFHLTKKIWVLVTVGLLEACSIISAAFGMWYLTLVSTAILITFLMVVFITSQNEIHSFFENINFKRDFKRLFSKDSKKIKPEYIFDRDKVYREIYKAVMDMSQAKRGALITVMKNDDLLDDSKIGTVIKQRGVDLNAPVNSELIETIFYVGTRLHDGAIIVKDDKIARAAVFFQSTSKALTGKYGSRHQAALGISENSDSVTIVVSEETGRIAIAFQGELTPVNPDNFMRIFQDYMAIDSANPIQNTEDEK